MREKAPCSLYSWFPYPYRFISLCGTTASLNTVEFFNIIGFCSCCHVPLSGVSIVFGWPSWRACFLVCLFVFVLVCVWVCCPETKEAGKKKSAECKKAPRSCLWSDETNYIVTTRNADIWVSSDSILFLGVTIQIQNQLSIQTILIWNNEIVHSVLIIWQIMQSKRSTVCETWFFFLVSWSLFLLESYINQLLDPQPRSMTPAPKTSHLSGREDKQADRSGSSSIVLTVRVVRRYLASLTM